MNKLTPLSKLLIVIAILGGIYYAATKFGLLDKMKAKVEEQQSEMSTKSPEPNSSESSSEATAGGSSSSSSSSSSSDSEASAIGNGFSYVAPEPINGKLKGVVELGASGFNSFIVRIDKDKNWKLEKAEFGNSLVTENMATDDDIRSGLKKYIGGMLDFGVSGRDIHFVVSSGAAKSEVTQKIVKNLKSLNYFVNTVSPEQEGSLALKCVLPKDFEEEAFVVDIGSGNTKISWKNGSSISALETYGSKYFQNDISDDVVYDEVKKICAKIPKSKTKTCFIIGGVPFKMAKQVRNGKERFTILKAPKDYRMEDAKDRAGVNIYKGIKDATGCEQFVFDWDANFTIGFLLGLP